MTDCPKPKLWRPRFSLRTLLIAVTLVCVYFAAWEVTKRASVAMVGSERNREDVIFLTEVSEISSPMPFVVGLKEVKIGLGRAKTDYYSIYLWFFGWSWQTPIRWEVGQQADNEWWGCTNSSPFPLP